MKKLWQQKSFWVAAIGTMVEYYDYALFAIFLPLISPVFFPGENAYQSLVHGYFVLTIAMVARPFGALFFGHIGDGVSRRKALLLSMYGIALATFVIGFTPSYAAIGIWSMIIIVAAKSVQLFCFGGEFNGAGIYVTEHAPPDSEGFISCLLAAIVVSGSLLACLMGIVLTLPGVPSWSWRVAFFIGGVIGVIGVLSRKRMVESPNFVAANSQELSLKQLIKKFPNELLAGIFLGGFATVPFTTVITFINPVLMAQHYFTPFQFMLLQAILVFISMLVLLLTGNVVDRLRPTRLMQMGSMSLVLLSFPLLVLVDTRQLWLMVLAQVVFIAINEVTFGPANVFYKKIFPMQYRYRGSSLSFCIGLSLLGGLTPIIENTLYHATGHFSAAGLWLLFVGLGTYWSMKRVLKPVINEAHLALSG